MFRSRLRSALSLAVLLIAFLLQLPTSSANQVSGSGRIPTLILTGENRTDWRWTSTHLRELLEATGRFDVEISVAPESALLDEDYRKRFQLFLVDYSGSRWGDEAEADFLNAVRAGTGVVALADSVAAFEGWKEYEELVGFRLGEYAYKSNFQPLDFRVSAAEHPILADFDGLGAHTDQLATGLEQVESETLKVLATVASANGGEPAQVGLQAGTYGKGRVVSTPLGNVSPERRQTWASHRNPNAEKLFLRACEWAATGKVTALERIEANTLSAADQAAGWKLLFDGTNAGGWRSPKGAALTEELWQVENGALRVSPGGDTSSWMSAQEYPEFELELDWKVEGGATTQIGIDRGGSGNAQGMQLGAQSAQGSSQVLRPADEFNHARVVATFDHVEHWLNGILIKTIYTDPASWARRVGSEGIGADAEMAELPLANIMLHSEGEAIWLRNIKIRHLPTAAATPAAGPQVVELFNGRDLQGWTWLPEAPSRTAPVAFSVGDEGQMVAAGMPLGELRSVATDQDFVLTLDWRFNPVNRTTGQGGILLRGVGTDPQFPDGIEVKLDHGQAGSLLRLGSMQMQRDRRRSNGDLMRPILDCEQAPGDWNHLEIDLRGGEIQVSLNGQVVNQASGVTSRQGVIALMNRRVEIQYRNLTLTPVR